MNIIVTGGAKRIGREIATHLLEKGHKVAITYAQSRADAESLQDAYPKSCHLIHLELASKESRASCIQLAVAKFGGKIDAIVNNASSYPTSTASELSHDHFQLMMEIHAWAPLELARLAKPHGLSSVVNLLDTRISGDQDADHVAYMWSKHALHQVSRTLAREWAGSVRVNSIAPGPILPPSSDLAKGIESAVRAVPMQRAGTPQEIAEAVDYLLHASYTTGQVLYVDGGRHLE